jgi:hypothetical protein
VRTAAREVAALLDAGPHDAVLVDAQTRSSRSRRFAKVYLAAVKALRRKVTAARVPAPMG